MRWATTEITREDNGHDYDVHTQSNFDYAFKALSDKRRFIDAVKQDGWGGFRQAVKSGALPKPNVEPIRRTA